MTLYNRNIRGGLHKPSFSSVSAIVLTVFIVLTIMVLPTSANLSDPTAAEIVNEVIQRNRLVRGFRAECNVIRQDPRFLKGFYPDGQMFSKMSFRGLVSLDSNTGGCHLYAQVEGLDYYIFDISSTAVSFAGQKRIINLLKKPTFISDNDPNTGFSPLPSPSVTPEQLLPDASPSPSPSMSALETGIRPWITDMSPGIVLTSEMHPLIFLAPYEIQGLSNSITYKILSRQSPILGFDCYLLQADPDNQAYTTKIWLTKKTQSVIQVELVSKTTGTKVTGTYLSHALPDPKTKFSIYNRVKVEVNDTPCYIAELSEPEINPTTSVVEQSKKTEESRIVNIRLRRASQYFTEEVAPFLSDNLLKFVIALCIILVFFFGRYIKFAVSRQEFSDELLVIDEEGGRCIEILDKLGYKVTPFSAEALTAERDLLGKGATQETTARPRALVVAQESFCEIKNYLFLVKAYVQEGGRVLVFYHSAKSISTLPFTPEMLPLPNQNTGVSFSFNREIITGVTEDELNRITATETGRETFLKVNGRSIKPVLVMANNKTTDISSTVVGVCRQGKGEYMLCQLKLDTVSTLRSKPAQLLLNDLVRHLLGLAPLPYELDDSNTTIN